MKTLSVKEVAGALGMTLRGVVQRLNKGQLKRTRKPNQFGVAEWSIYATKEILQAIEIKKNGGQYVAPGQVNFLPEEAEAIEAEEVSYGESDESDGPTSCKRSKWNAWSCGKEKRRSTNRRDNFDCFQTCRSKQKQSGRK